MNTNSIRITKRRQRRGSVSFNPDHQYVLKAVDEFLKSGGQIVQIHADEKTFQQSIMINDGSLDADEFLLGG
ncbi:hypothetical protein KKA14_03775 [bacterium]|nr:hypothetical protein [bacterium]